MSRKPGAIHPPPPPAPAPPEPEPEPEVETKATPKRKRRVFDPSHYSRHDVVPGFLYMARNDKHREGLYKLGYCVQSPEGRVAALEAQHRKALDVGHFSLVYSVPVSASYNTEQALFDVLAEVRPVLKREFFYQREDFLIRALDAAHAFSFGNSNALTDFHDWSLGQEPLARPPREMHAPVHPMNSPNGGWIYATRVMWHQENLFRVSYSRNDPRTQLVKLDAVQKKHTSQIGFHTLALCVSVGDVKSAWRALYPKLASAPKKVGGSRVYFYIPLAQLIQLVSEVCAIQSPPKSPVSSEPLGLISVQQVYGRVPSSWAPWAAPCPSCDATLRFTGAIGAQDSVKCPSCDAYLTCTIGASRAHVGWTYGAW